MPAEPKTMRIIELRSENIKRLKAVMIHPSGDIIQITGKNAEGKSSVLDSIELALRGAEAIKKNPAVIRKGEEKAVVELDLGDIIVRRRFTQKDSYLDVFTKDGAKYPSPQAVLDKMLASIAFDPLQFTNMDAPQQVKTLLEFTEIAINLDEQDGKIKEAFEERAVANKLFARAKSIMESTVQPADLTIHEDSDTTALLAEQQALTKEDGSLSLEINTIISEGTAARKHSEDITKRIEDTEKFLAQLKEDQVKASQLLAEKQKQYEQKKETYDAKGYAERIKAITERIQKSSSSRQHNELVTKYNAVKEEFTVAESSVKEREESLKNLREERERAIKEAKFPIEGLGISDEGVTFNGIPFVQCSSAERLQVGIAMVIAMNPTIRVIRIQDGALLDSESMKIVEEMAEQFNMQFWIERVDESGKVGIVIEDGQISVNNYLVPAAEIAPPVDEKPAKKTKRAPKTA